MSDVERIMYRWRRMMPQEREAALQSRRTTRVPWHAPPHYQAAGGHYLLTAACYEHRPWIGSTPERMADFESKLLAALRPHCPQVFTWTVLPNHYHALVRARTSAPC